MMAVRLRPSTSATPFCVARVIVLFALLGIIPQIASEWDAGGWDKRRLYIGAVLPHSSFHIRQYKKVLQMGTDEFKKSKSTFANIYKEFRYELVTLPLYPSPTQILDALCEKFLSKNVTVILYMSNTESYGSNTASSQYLLQLTGYLGIPVIAWNADNSGLVKDQKRSTSMTLQLAPSIEHQTAAMLSILKRYKWHQFSIVTSQIAGFNEFIQAVLDKINPEKADFRFTHLSTIRVDLGSEVEISAKLSKLLETDTRIILLYSTESEAKVIMEIAAELGLTGKDFVWVVTQSIVGTMQQEIHQLTPGMLGVHFDTSTNSLLEQVRSALKVFGQGLELYVNDQQNVNRSLLPNLSCLGQGDSRWSSGQHLYRYLRNVSVNVLADDHKLVEFNSDGTLKNADLEVVNLNEQHKWERIGKWSNDVLEIKDIVWPGNSHVPPPGVPEKFHLKAVFLEEPPFVKLEMPDPISGKCINRGVICRIAKESDIAGMNISLAMRNTSYFQCCSGFSVDLMEKYAEDLKFTYEMFRVEDGRWGTEVNKKWNGLIATLLNKKADLVMTALKINEERETVVDFTVPFMDTGIAIIVLKRTGIISPKAFLEPFDTISWLFILLGSIQLATFAIFIFEWCSPLGYDRKLRPPRDHKFSLFRTYWLVWAILFGASVSVDCPRGYTAKYMSSIWAMFAVVFLAIYTANLAAFMITTEEYYKLQGIDDERLLNPHSVKPSLRFGTIPYGNTEAILSKHYPEMYGYMKPYNRSTVAEGITSLKRGELEAFVYDATVLTYLVGQDNGCKILTVGSWYATSGYGVAFPKYSKHLQPFNKLMMAYKDHGDLDRLQRFWLHVGCKQGRKDRTSSKPLSLDQFMSAFLLLACGIALAFLILALERIYFTYVRKHLAKKDTGGCCALISLSMGKSLSFRGAVFEAQDVIRQHQCKDPLCDLHLWKVKHELDMARLHIERLEVELKKCSSKTYDLRSAITNDTAILKPRDMTHERVTTNEPQRPIGPGKYHEGYYYQPVALSDVAEIETVL